MKTILLHPSYFPSIEQMVAVAQAEHVIFEMEDNYQKQTYRSRAYIAHSNGSLLLNVPIKHSKNGIRQKTKNVCIENNFKWQSEHWKSLQSAYRTSPFFEYYEDELAPLFMEPAENLMQHNLTVFETLCELIGLEVEVSQTSAYEKDPTNAIDWRFLIVAKRKTNFTQKPYTQVLEANHGFLPNLSVLDLLFNEGPNTLGYLEAQLLQF